MPLTNEQIPSTSKSKISKSSSHARHSSADIDLTQPKFPRIEDCVHFHYETLGYGRIKVSFVEESADGLKINGSLSFESFNPAFIIKISCKENTWVVRRSIDHFETLDTWLHECVFDRRFSHLPVLQSDVLKTKDLDDIQSELRSYLKILSGIIDVEGTERQIFCAPVLHWLEMDNQGRNLVPHALGDVADINIPAIAAARVIRRYQACDDDELTLNVGDMVSIIEMGASGWWRGKQGLRVGSFPCQCVRRINSATDIVGTHERSFSPPNLGTPGHVTPIARKHGKFMDFLRSFLDTRPSKAHLKKKGILRERVFGCDLGELLHRTDEEIPAVVSDCLRFIEKYGVVDGIYRISGVASHIRHLKYEFDSDRRPDLENAILDLPKLGNIPGMSRESNFKCDAHSVAGLCKLYFRELPNPLLTYQLYNRFASAVTDYDVEDRLLKVHDVIQQLPPPHYRTLKQLINHLRFMAENDDKTSMHSRNLAIVWAPNLLRSREIEAGLAAFTEARVQSVVTEFLIVNGDLLFSEKLQTIQYDQEHKPPRPRSLMILPTPKLISLQEAQARSKSGVVTPVSHQTTPIEGAIGGVRLRNPSSKASSSEKRKRHKKTTSTSNPYPSCSPYPVRTSKKQGHRQTASYSEVLSSTPHTPKPCSPPRTNGWKVKLGSLLRKSTAQPRKPSREASLRRSQSCDSLILSHGFHLKTTENNEESEFSDLKQQISRAKSCEGTGLSDRRFPEPQVPHNHEQAPGKQYSFEPIKYSDDVCSPKKSPDFISTSFLDPDPSSVVERKGFEPLNCGMRKSSSSNAASNALDLDDVHASGDDFHSDTIERSPKILFPTKKGSKILSAKLISIADSRRSLTASDMAMPFRNGKATIPPDKRSDSRFPDHNANPAPRSDGRFPSTDKQQTSVNVVQQTNKSSNNNTRSRYHNDQSESLDALTADFITATIDDSRGKAPRSSAVERLSAGKKGSTTFKPKPSTSTTGTESQVGTSALAAESEAPMNRHVSVQFYDVPSNDDARISDHYGSFIALIGSDTQDVVGGKRDEVRFKTEKTNYRLTDTAHAKKTSFRPFLHPRNKIPTAASSFLYPDESNPNKDFASTQSSFGSRLHPGTLETFSPDGRRRENYPNTPPTARIHSRTESFPPHSHPLLQQRSGGHYGNQNRGEFQDCRFPDDFNHPHPSTHGSRDYPGYGESPLSANRIPAFRGNRSYSSGTEFDVPSERRFYCSDRDSNPSFSAVSFENKTYEHSSRFRGRFSASRTRSYDVTSDRSQMIPDCPKYHESRGHYNTKFVKPLSHSPAPPKPSPAYDNPSYELRPIYYSGQGRYAFAKDRRRPSLVTSVRHDNVALSWV